MPSEKEIRKLAAIMHADVKGYSRLMGEDEANTVHALKECRRLFADTIRSHGGRVVNAPGDSILAEFPSVVSAVQCAAEIQNRLNTRNAELPENRKMLFRIGVNLGDVIQSEDAIYGDGVNIAARIEALAEAGGVSISRTVFNHVSTKLKYGYAYQGEHQVKNIANPVKVYKLLTAAEDAGKLIGEEPKDLSIKWIWPTTVVAAIVVALIGYHIYHKISKPEFEPASVEKMAYPLPEKPSIAILPFDNMSGDPDQEYLIDGITEDIITTLSKSDALFVIARNSTFSYKGKPVKIKQVAEELGVRYVLEGSVRKTEDRIRITSQLIDAVLGHHLWAERYDRELKDIFALQDEITTKIVTSLQVMLTDGEQALISNKKQISLDVKLKIMELASLWHKGTVASHMRHGQVAQELIDLAPEVSFGYSSLGWYYWFLVVSGKSPSPQESIAKAFKLAQKALALDEYSPFPYALLSNLYTMLKQYDKAIAAGERGVALCPNGAHNHCALGITLSYAGKPDEAIDHFKYAIRLDPFPEYYYFLHLGRCYMLKGQYEEALSEFKRALHIRPDAIHTNIALAAVYALLDRQEAANAAAKSVLEINPGFSVERASKGLPYKNLSDLKLITDALKKAGLPATPPLPLPDKPSIAVLPFVNMSDNPGQEYFCDGLTENIIYSLSKISDLFVIARNSSFFYKNKPIKVRRVSRDLGVKYVLDGSIQRSGERIRITAQLIDAISDHHVWAERYDRNIRDLFEIQDDITMKIVNALSAKLTFGERGLSISKGTSNLDAFLKVLEAKGLIHRWDREGNDKARQLFKEAIVLDPMYPGAYHGLAATYMNDVWFGWGSSIKESFSLWRKFSEKAIELDDSFSMAYGLLGHLFSWMKKHEKAIELCEKAISLNTNNADAYVWLGMTLNFADRAEEAIPHIKKAIRLNPFTPSWYYVNLGLSYRMSRQFDDAIEAYQKALKRSPRNLYAHLGLTATFIYAGEEEAGRKQAAKIMELYPKFSLEKVSKSWSSYKNEDTKKGFMAALQKAGLK